MTQSFDDWIADQEYNWEAHRAGRAARKASIQALCAAGRTPYQEHRRLRGAYLRLERRDDLTPEIIGAENIRLAEREFIRSIYAGNLV